MDGSGEDLFGLDRYQEKTRAFNLLAFLNEKLGAWNDHIHTLFAAFDADGLGFLDVDRMIQRLMVDLNTLLDQVCKEKKKYREECKKLRESIKPVPGALGAYSNPEPPVPPVSSVEVLEESSRSSKRPGDGSKKKKAKKIRVVPPLPPPPATPTVELVEDDLLAQYLREHPLES